MPTLPQLLSELQFINYETALLGLLITGTVLLVSRDWRFLILALLAQYILVGLILANLVRSDIAVLKVLIGAFICPILFLSARQVSGTALSISRFRANLSGRQERRLVNWWRTASRQTSRLTSTGSLFRLFVVLLMILVATTLSNTFSLPNLAPTVTTAVYWLVLVGLVILILTEDPLKAGHGLLTVFVGFDLYYATLERSLLLTGLWGTVNLVIALAVGYLVVVKGTAPEEEN